MSETYEADLPALWWREFRSSPKVLEDPADADPGLELNRLADWIERWSPDSLALTDPRRHVDAIRWLGVVPEWRAAMIPPEVVVAALDDAYGAAAEAAALLYLEGETSFAPVRQATRGAPERLAVRSAGHLRRMRSVLQYAAQRISDPLMQEPVITWSPTGIPCRGTPLEALAATLRRMHTGDATGPLQASARVAAAMGLMASDNEDWIRGAAAAVRRYAPVLGYPGADPLAEITGAMQAPSAKGTPRRLALVTAFDRIVAATPAYVEQLAAGQQGLRAAPVSALGGGYLTTVKYPASAGYRKLARAANCPPPDCLSMLS